MMFGVAHQIRITANTHLVDPQEVNRRCWLSVAAASALAPTSQAQCGFPPISQDAIPYAAPLEDGQRLA